MGDQIMQSFLYIPPFMCFPLNQTLRNIEKRLLFPTLSHFGKGTTIINRGKISPGTEGN